MGVLTCLGTKRLKHLSSWCSNEHYEIKHRKPKRNYP
uniref:Uncharacterized protein n=1 Tax=Anguilla anguilla TaxID=7936 RepID=A0A0E9W0Z5_ANGAN